MVSASYPTSEPLGLRLLSPALNVPRSLKLMDKDLEELNGMPSKTFSFCFFWCFYPQEVLIFH